MDVVKQRFVDLLAPNNEQFIASLRSDVQELLQRFNTSCLFTDVPYDSKRRAGWPVMSHLSRMFTFSQLVHLQPDAVPGLLEKTVCGLDWWFVHRPVCPNWYDQEISGPNNLGATLLMLPEGALAPNQSAAAKELIEEATWWDNWTGSNLLYMLRAQIMRGLAFGNQTAVAQGFSVGFAAVHAFRQSEDGLQHDGSFHQHGPQLLAGSYGSEFTGHVLELAVLGAGTQWAAPSAAEDALSLVLVDGQQWMMSFGAASDGTSRQVLFDWQVVGRATTRPPTGASDPRGFILPSYVAEMAASNASGRAADWAALAQRLNTTSGEAPPPLVGARVYWDSDYLVLSAGHWRFSVHMVSTRTIGGACVNEEGKLSRRQSNGATALYYSGREYEGAFPMWDYRRPPGVSGPIGDGFELNCDNAKTMGGSAFVGGTTAAARNATGAGQPVLVGAMELADKEELTGRRAWIALNGSVLAIGSRLITPRKGASLATTLDTSNLLGPVSFGTASGGAALVPGNHTEPLGRDNRWLLHGRTAFVFPAEHQGDAGPASVAVSNTNLTGDWGDLGPRSEVVTRPIFDASLRHNGSDSAPGSSGASYAYILVPDAPSASGMPSLAASLAGIAVARGPDAEAAAHPASGAMGAVMWAANADEDGPSGKAWAPVEPAKGFGVAAARPSVVAFSTGDGGAVNIGASTPGSEAGSVSVFLSRPLVCSACSSAGSGWTKVVVPLPGKPGGDDFIGAPGFVVAHPA